MRGRGDAWMAGFTSAAEKWLQRFLHCSVGSLAADVCCGRYVGTLQQGTYVTSQTMVPNFTQAQPLVGDVKHYFKVLYR